MVKPFQRPRRETDTRYRDALRGTNFRRYFQGA